MQLCPVCRSGHIYYHCSFVFFIDAHDAACIELLTQLLYTRGFD